MRKIIDDQPDESKIRLSVPVIYEQLKKSNSSLNRKPKKLLEDSLERVLEVMKSEGLCGDDEADSVEGDFEGLEEPPAKVCNGNLQLAWGSILTALSALGSQWRQPEYRRRMVNRQSNTLSQERVRLFQTKRNQR